MPTQILTYGATVHVAETPTQVQAAVDGALAGTTGPVAPWVELTAMDESVWPYEPHASKKVRIRGDAVHALNDPQWT